MGLLMGASKHGSPAEGVGHTAFGIYIVSARLRGKKNKAVVPPALNELPPNLAFPNSVLENLCLPEYFY